MALTWAAIWATAGSTLARVLGFNPDPPLPLFFAPLGLGTGIIFAGMLIILEKRRTLDQISPLRFAGWGALSGLLISGVVIAAAALGGEMIGAQVLMLGLVPVVASAACAAGSLAVARRAERRELAATTTPTARGTLP